MGTSVRPLDPREAFSRLARTGGRSLGQVGLGIGESAFATAEGLTNLIQRFGPEVLSNFIANELEPIVERGDDLVRGALPPQGLGEVGLRLGGRLAGDVVQMLASGGPARAGVRALGGGRVAAGLVGSLPLATVQASAGPEESTVGSLGALLERAGREGPVSRGLSALAEDPDARVATEVGIDLLTGALTEAAAAGLRRARGPRVPRDVGGGSPLLPRGRGTSPGVALGANRTTTDLARNVPDEGDLFSMIGRSDRLGEAAFTGRGGIIPQESISERLIQGTGGLTARQRVDLTRKVRMRVFPAIEEIMGESAVRSGFDTPAVARTSEGLGVFEGAINPNTIYNLGDVPAQLIEQRAAAHGIVEGQNAAVWFRLIGDDAVNPVNPGRAYVIAGPNGSNLDPADFRELHQITSTDPSFAPLSAGSTFFEGRAIYRNFSDVSEQDYAALVREAADRMRREVDLELVRVEGNLLDGPTAYRAAFAGDQEALERLLRLHEREVRPIFGSVGASLGDPNVAQQSRQFIDEIRRGAREADRARSEVLPELVLAGALAGGAAAAAPRRSEGEDIAMASTLGALAGLSPPRKALPEHLASVNGEVDARPGPNRDVSGIGYVAKYLRPEDAVNFRQSTARRFMDLIEALPSVGEVNQAAASAVANTNWFKQVAEVATEIFGPDATRFVSLLTVVNPIQPVKQNVVNTLNIYNAWVRAGRPVDAESVFTIIRNSVPSDEIASPRPSARGLVQRAREEFGFTELDPRAGEHILREQLLDLPLRERRALEAVEPWADNAVEVLIGGDPVGFAKSEPNATQFALNLIEETSNSTLKTWLAKLSAWAERLFGGGGASQPKDLPPEVAARAGADQMADQLTRLTGVQWTPEETQETLWGMAYALGEETPNNFHDFRSLLNEPAYKEILIRGNAAPPGRARPSGAVVARAASEAEAVARRAEQRSSFQRVEGGAFRTA